MAQPIRPKSVQTRVKVNSRLVGEERRKPIMPGPWIYVGDFVAPDDPGNDPPYTSWQSPPWQNGWTWLDTAYVAFRHGVDGLTEFSGTVDAAGATSGTTAFTLPVAYRGNTPFSFITDLDLGAGSFSAARVLVQANGQVKIYFPISP